MVIIFPSVALWAFRNECTRVCALPLVYSKHLTTRYIADLKVSEMME